MYHDDRTVSIESSGRVRDGDLGEEWCSPSGRSGDARAMKEAVVRPGSRVHISDNDGQVARSPDPKRRVRPWATDSLSADSPLGGALIGGHVGQEDEVVLHTSLPVRRVKIEAIE